MSFRVVKTQILNQPSSGSSESDGEPDYVFDVKLSCDHKSFVVSSSDRAIHLYDTESFSLKVRLRVHKDRISNIQFSKHSPNLLWTASDDKSVKLWDLNHPVNCENKPIITFKFEEEVQAFAVNHDDSLLAVGVGCDIVFLDVNKAKATKSLVVSSSSLQSYELGRYSDIHSDVVTQLEFSPNDMSVLLSAGEDGLICAYDMSVDESEEAVVSILNVGCPIRKFGFFGPNLEGVYALSTVETASFWHYPSAQRLGHFDDLREKLHVDYLVDCLYDPSNSTLQLLLGSYGGNGSFVLIQPGEYTCIGTGFYNEHVSMIRCCTPMTRNSYITGGEDGKILLWELQDMGTSSSNPVKTEISIAANMGECIGEGDESSHYEESMMTNSADAIRIDTTTTSTHRKSKVSKNRSLKQKNPRNSSSELRNKPY